MGLTIEWIISKVVLIIRKVDIGLSVWFYIINKLFFEDIRE